MFKIKPMAKKMYAYINPLTDLYGEPMNTYYLMEVNTVM